jgi:hypothetical protein
MVGAGGMRRSDAGHNANYLRKSANAVTVRAMLADRANSPNNRRPTALLAIAAILFQALLFGWHHHELLFAARLSHAVASAPDGAASPPGEDADGCEICQTLHHQSAATPEALFAPALPPLSAAPAPHEAEFTVGALALAFRARAPPLC